MPTDFAHKWTSWAISTPPANAGWSNLWSRNFNRWIKNENVHIVLSSPTHTNLLMNVANLRMFLQITFLLEDGGRRSRIKFLWRIWNNKSARTQKLNDTVSIYRHWAIAMQCNDNQILFFTFESQNRNFKMKINTTVWLIIVFMVCFYLKFRWLFLKW